MEVRIFVLLLYVSLTFICHRCHSSRTGRKDVVAVLPSQVNGQNLSAMLKEEKNVATIFLRNDGLRSLLSASIRLQTIGNASEYALLFTRQLASRLFQEVSEGIPALGSNNTLMRLDKRSCIREAAYDSHRPSTCLECDNEYTQAFLAIVNHFEFKKIAILTSNEPPLKTFSEQLYKSVRAKVFKSGSRLESYVARFQLSTNPVSTDEISRILFDVDYNNARFIIVLANAEMVDLIFKIASKNEMMGLDTTWMLIEIGKKLHWSQMPTRTMNIFVKIDGQHKWNWKEISSVIDAMSDLNHDDSMKSGKQVQHRINCTNGTAMQIGAVMQQTGRYESDWDTVFTWTRRNGLVISPLGMNWLKLHKKVLIKTELTVVSIIAVPFTYMAKQYEHWDDHGHYKCSSGVPCKFKKVANNMTMWNRTCCIGHSIELLQLLAKDLNFVPNVYIVEDGSYGSKVNGSWNGLIGDVHRKKADLAVAPLMLTKGRSEAVDFLAPFSEVKQGMILLRNRKPTVHDHINFRFLSSLEGNLLWGFGVFFVIGLLMIYLYEWTSLKCQAMVHGGTTDSTNLLSTTFTYMVGITFQRDLGGRNPTGVGARLAALLVAFGMVVGMTAYTAIMTATTVIQEERDPFRGMQDERMKNPTAKFKFATVTDSSTESYFREEPRLEKIFRFIKKYNTKDSDEGVRKLLNGELDGFIFDSHVLQHYVNRERNCLLSLMYLKNAEMMLGFALQKGSPWKDVMSRKFIKYVDAGIVLKLFKKWMGPSCRNSKSIHDTKYSIAYFSAMFICLAGTSLLLLLVSVCSYSAVKCREKKFKLTQGLS